MKGLIVKEPWYVFILDGLKDIELRGERVNFRGTIGIIKSGSKMVYGTVDIIDCIEITTEEEYEKYKDRHRYPLPFSSVGYKKLYGWVLANPVKYAKPVPYEHKLGCVKWVNI